MVDAYLEEVKHHPVETCILGQATAVRFGSSKNCAQTVVIAGDPPNCWHLCIGMSSWEQEQHPKCRPKGTGKIQVRLLQHYVSN